MSLGHDPTEDLLFVKLHKKPVGGGMGHFKFAVIKVETAHVVLQYDVSKSWCAVMSELFYRGSKTMVSRR